MYKFVGLLIIALFGAVICGPAEYDKEHTWVAGKLSEPLPSNTLIGGVNSEGYLLRVGRTFFNGSVIPAGIDVETGSSRSYIFDGVFTNSIYDLLVTQHNMTYEWVRSFDGFLEENAISVGTTSWEERAFICRTKVSGSILIGTLLLSEKGCHIRFNTYDKYEVLTAIPNLNSN